MVLDYLKLQNQFKQNQFGSLYLFYGKDKYLLNNALKCIKKNFGDMINGINYIQIDDSNIQNIISDIETPAFGFPKKLIIVNESGILKKKNKAIEEDSEEFEEENFSGDFKNVLKDYIKENYGIIKESSIIVFIEEDVNKTLGLYKMIEEKGIVCDFKELDKKDVINELKRTCNLYKVNASYEVLSLLVDISGTNLQELLNEIRKLIEYVGNGGTITSEIVSKLAIKKIESIIFDLTEALGKKSIVKAMNVLNELWYIKEPTQKIVVMLYGHFKKLYLTKLSIEENRNIPEAIDIKTNSDYVINKYKEQSRCFKKQELEKVMQELVELDANNKLGRMNLDVGLETIMCMYCS